MRGIRIRGARALTVALLVLVAALTPASAHAQSGPCAGIMRPLVAFAEESITVSSAAIGLTQSSMSASGGVVAVAAKVEVKTAAILYRELANTPTATLSYAAAVGDRFWVCGPSLTSLRMIRSSSDATAFVTYYRMN